MKARRWVVLGVLMIAAIGLMPVRGDAQQSRGTRVDIDKDDISGVVMSSKGPEGGVWVIAETTDLPTKYARIVVTDDQAAATLCRTCRRPTIRSSSGATA